MASCNQCGGNHSVGDAIAAIRAIADAAPVQAVADAVRNSDSGGTVMRPADLPQGMDLKAFAKLNDSLMHSNEMSDFSVHTYLPNTASYFLHEHDGKVMLMHRPDAVSREKKGAKTGDADMLFGPKKFAATEAMARAQREFWGNRPS